MSSMVSLIAAVPNMSSSEPFDKQTIMQRHLFENAIH